MQEGGRRRRARGGRNERGGGWDGLMCGIVVEKCCSSRGFEMEETGR